MPISIHKFAFTAFCIPTILTACGTPYVEPKAGAVAAVSLVAGAGSRQALVHHLEAGECSGKKLLAILGPTPTKFAFDELHQVVPEKTIKVSANAPFFAQVHDTRTEYPFERSCSATIEFQPQPNRSYRLVWNYYRTSCQIQVLTENPVSKLWQAEESAKSSRQRCIS